jgi:ABC-2 type transport system permease protein
LSSHHSQAELSSVPVASGGLAEQSARAGESGPARAGFLLPAVSLWWRELVRFYRQPSRWVGVLLSPLVFWLVIGSGLGKSFSVGVGDDAGRGYLEYFFPGTLILILLFTSIFCMMSVIEDRREGFLSSVLVSPAPRASLVMGKVMGGTTLAVLQGIMFLLFAPTVGITPSLAQIAELLGIMFLIAFGLTALGFCIAWRLDSTHGFHALVNLLLIPMWLLSGALFPISGASQWVGWLMRLNPLTYGVTALRHALYNGAQPRGEIAGFSVSLAVTACAAVAIFLVALFMASRRARAGGHSG